MRGNELNGAVFYVCNSLLHNSRHVGADDIQIFCRKAEDLRNAVVKRGQRFYVVVAQVVWADGAAGRRHVENAAGPAQADGDSFWRIRESDAQYGNLLKVYAQDRREGQVPIGGGNDDVICCGKLMGVVEHWRRHRMRGDKGVSFFQLFPVKGVKGFLIQIDFRYRSGYFFQYFLSQCKSTGLRAGAGIDE